MKNKLPDKRGVLVNNFIKFLIASIFLPGCVYYRPSTISTTSLNGVYEKPLLVSSGESDAYYIFGFIGPFGDDSIKAALEKAKGQTNADSVVNVFVDRKTTIYPFTILPIVIKNSTRVHGTLIRYEEQSGVRPKSMVETETAIEQERIRKLIALFSNCPRNYHVFLTLSNGKEVDGKFKKYESEIVELTDSSGKKSYKFKLRDIKEVVFRDY